MFFILFITNFLKTAFGLNLIHLIQLIQELFEHGEKMDFLISPSFPFLIWWIYVSIKAQNMRPLALGPSSTCSRIPGSHFYVISFQKSKDYKLGWNLGVRVLKLCH